MHLLNALPQRLDPGATPTFAGLISATLTAPAATNLTLTSGLVGTNRVNFPDTLSASSATAGAVTIGNGTAATNVAIGGGKIVSGDVFNSVKTGNGAQNAFGFATASAVGWTYTSIDVNDVNGGIIAPYLNGSCFGYLTVNATGPLLQSRNNYAAQVFNSSNIGLSVAHSTGDVTLNSTTAASANAGALVIAGGISAGNTGSAASYFGGAVSGNRAVSTGVANTNGDISLTINGNSSIGTAARWINQPSSAAYNWQLGTNLSGNWFSFMASTVVDGTTFSTDALKLTNAGAATFAGAVTIGNTVNTVSPTSPNRTITMVVNGVTLYLAAKTTND